MGTTGEGEAEPEDVLGSCSSAERLFAQHVARVEAGDPCDFESLCAEHAELVPELRELEKGWRRVRGALAEIGAPALRAETPLLSIVLPEGDGFSRELLERLGKRQRPSDRYRSEGELARGGMARIVRVWDVDLRRHLAMKLLLPRGEAGKRGTPPRSLGRFLEEAQVAGQLDHPGIVPVHELGIDAEGRVFFTMKLVKGRELKEVIDDVHAQSEEWTLARAVGVVVKVCEAMAYAHGKGVLHRDLKPSNVMVGRFGEVYVMDWGLARAPGGTDVKDIRVSEPPEVSAELRSDRRDAAGSTPDSPLFTMDGDVIGTPSYMPPEQALGRISELGPQSDVYSVGAMLYHLLAGHPPYAPRDGKATNHMVLLWVRETAPAEIAGLVPDAPPELVAICKRAMERDPARRYATMLELADDLRRWLEGRVVRAYASGAWPELRKWVGRNRGMAAALGGIAALALVSSLGWAWLEKQQRTALAALNEDKTQLSDVLGVRTLLAEANELTSDDEGIRRMERWVERARDVLSRRAAYAPKALLAASAPRAVDNEELTALASSLDRLDVELARTSVFLDEVRALPQRTLEEPRALWDEAIEGVSVSAPYLGLRIEPQLGLVPLWQDGASGLWEFWHVLSGEKPERDEETGRIDYRPESGIVLVLVPGGFFEMGSPEKELGRSPDERLHEVVVEPFFLAKFEVTQGQWTRVTGENPAYYPSGIERAGVVASEIHPVESVTWTECDHFARRIGLLLPSEEQWEYVARAGTRTAYCWGDSPDRSEGRENFADQSVAAITAARVATQPAPWNDGYPFHAPVGSFPANPLGLFDLHGNIGEWTCGRYDRYYEFTEAEREDMFAAEVIPPAWRLLRSRVVRGGNYFYGPGFARSALRQPVDPSNANFMSGARLARKLERP